MNKLLLISFPFAVALSIAIFYYIESPYNVIVIASCVIIGMLVGHLVRSKYSTHKGYNFEKQNDD